MLLYKRQKAKNVNKKSGLEPVEKRLRLYNQYPGSYQNIESMTADLQRIADMGFKQVWINPFYKTCQENYITPKKTHCPYAMQNHLAVDADYQGSFADIKKYTERARELGLVPLFDFVSLHVAIDHPFVNGDPLLLEKGIDTKLWFKRHSNGNLKLKGLDENYNATDNNPYSDTAAFNYEDPNIRNEIFEHFWKPFIDQNIALGFMGARIDAPGQIPRVVHEQLLNYINDKCAEAYGKKAYLVAETIGESAKYLSKDVSAVGGIATHMMNSVWWMPGADGQGNHHYTEWKNDSNWWTEGKGILQGAAPTAGHSGSHDEERFAEILKLKGITDPIVIKQRMLEKIMQAAFGSDGGHILAYGDEYGVEERINLHERHVINLQKEKKIDLCEEIASVNEIVRQLPAPTYPEWTQRVFYDKYPELVIFIVHQGEGFTGNSHVIIGNSYNDENKNIVVNQKMLIEILHANGRNDSEAKRQLPRTVYLCGNLKSDKDLTVQVIATKQRNKPTDKPIPAKL